MALPKAANIKFLVTLGDVTKIFPEVPQLVVLPFESLEQILFNMLIMLLGDLWQCVLKPLMNSPEWGAEEQNCSSRFEKVEFWILGYLILDKCLQPSLQFCQWVFKIYLQDDDAAKTVRYEYQGFRTPRS